MQPRRSGDRLSFREYTVQGRGCGVGCGGGHNAVRSRAGACYAVNGVFRRQGRVAARHRHILRCRLSDADKSRGPAPYKKTRHEKRRPKQQRPGSFVRHGHCHPPFSRGYCGGRELRHGRCERCGHCVLGHCVSEHSRGHDNHPAASEGGHRQAPSRRYCVHKRLCRGRRRVLRLLCHHLVDGAAAVCAGLCGGHDVVCDSRRRLRQLPLQARQEPPPWERLRELRAHPRPRS